MVRGERPMPVPCSPPHPPQQQLMAGSWGEVGDEMGVDRVSGGQSWVNELWIEWTRSGSALALSFS